MADILFADLLAEHGAEVDSAIAFIEGKNPTTKHADEGRLLGARWDVDVAAAVPPPPPDPVVTTTKMFPTPLSPQPAGTSLVLQATVTPAFAGTVQFDDDGVPFGSPAVVDPSTGIARMTWSAYSPPGLHVIYATFTPADPLVAAPSKSFHNNFTTTSPVTPPPPTPSSTTLLGSSTGAAEGGTVASTLEQMPDCQALRVYDQAASMIAASKDFREAVAAMKLVVGGEVLYSFKQMPSDAAFIAVLADWAKAGCKIRWCYNHEADNPSKNINAAQFVKDFEHLIAVGNAHPSATVEEYSCFMAYLLDPNHPHGDPESWYVPSARVMGFDDYVLSNYARVVAYCKSKGKPFILPEWGGGGKDDNAALAFAKSMVALWVDNPPEVACWFNADGTGASTALKNIPKTRDFLNSQFG